MLGLPLWALVALVNLAAVVGFAIMVVDELKPLASWPFRPALGILILIVLVVFGAPLVVLIVGRTTRDRLQRWHTARRRP